MKKKASNPTEPKATTPASVPSEPKKPAHKPPINPFTADGGRTLGRDRKNGPSRTAWKT